MHHVDNGTETIVPFRWCSAAKLGLEWFRNNTRLFKGYARQPPSRFWLPIQEARVTYASKNTYSMWDIWSSSNERQWGELRRHWRQNLLCLIFGVIHVNLTLQRHIFANFCRMLLQCGKKDITMQWVPPPPLSVRRMSKCFLIYAMLHHQYKYHTLLPLLPDCYIFLWLSFQPLSWSQKALLFVAKELMSIHSRGK